MCSACLSFDSTAQEYEKLFKSQKMIVKPATPEHVARNGLGFGITMKPEEASRVDPPNGAEFRKLLEEQLSRERLQGHDYCPNGYEIDRVNYFKHWYTEIWVNCKN